MPSKMYNMYSYLSMLGWKLSNINKRGLRRGIDVQYPIIKLALVTEYYEYTL